MSTQFDQLTERRFTNSMKWDVKEHELPMWVADMDFETAPVVKEAILRKAELGIYGYTSIPEEFQESIIHWWQQRHQFVMQKEWIVFCTGIVPAISSIIRRMTNVAEQVVVLSPTYNIFYNSIVNNGRSILASELIYDGGLYQIDFDDLEKKLAHPQTTMMLLCNPQNPIGKIWERETLERIGHLCETYHVLIVSDEIHCDLCAPGTAYVPFASINEQCALNSITALSASKAFNLAGLQSASVVIPNEAIRAKVERGFNTDEIAEPNVFAMEASIAAFTHGSEWLDELRGYLEMNKQLVASYLKNHIPELSMITSQATYLLWIDCRCITKNSNDFCAFLRAETGLWLSSGSAYGLSGEGFVRMNIACPIERLRDGLQRFAAGIQAYKATYNQ